MNGGRKDKEITLMGKNTFVIKKGEKKRNLMSLSSFGAILVLVDAGVGGAEDVRQHHRRRLADQRVDLGRRGSHRHRLGAGGG